MTHLEEFDRLLAAEHERRAQEDLRKVMATGEGRRVLYSILASAGVYARAFTGEALTTAHNEGRREVGISLLERIEAQAPGSYLGMLREAIDEQTLIENGRRNARDKDALEAEGD